MADEIIMVTAVILAVGVMMFSARPISSFVNRHPTVKVLALSFLLLIGVSLVGDGLGMHIPKGYIYFAVCFSVLVEAINLRVRRAAAPVHLHAPYMLCNHVGTGISFSGKRTNRAVGGML